MFSIEEAGNLQARLQEGPEARSRFKRNHIKELIAAQIRMLRDKRGWSQTELGDIAGIKQSRVSVLEDPEYSGVTVNTLLKLSDAFDVGLVVRFVPFNDLFQFTLDLGPGDLAPPSFSGEQLSFASMQPQSPVWSPATLEVNGTVAYVVIGQGASFYNQGASFYGFTNDVAARAQEIQRWKVLRPVDATSGDPLGQLSELKTEPQEVLRVEVA